MLTPMLLRRALTTVCCQLQAQQLCLTFWWQVLHSWIQTNWFVKNGLDCLAKTLNTRICGIFGYVFAVVLKIKSFL